MQKLSSVGTAVSSPATSQEALLLYGHLQDKQTDLCNLSGNVDATLCLYHRPLRTPVSRLLPEKVGATKKLVSFVPSEVQHSDLQRPPRVRARRRRVCTRRNHLFGVPDWDLLPSLLFGHRRRPVVVVRQVQPGVPHLLFVSGAVGSARRRLVLSGVFGRERRRDDGQNRDGSERRRVRTVRLATFQLFGGSAEKTETRAHREQQFRRKDGRGSARLRLRTVTKC